METPAHPLTKRELVETIIEFERDYGLWPGSHTPSELTQMDSHHLAKLRDLYAHAIDICMIERRRHTEGEGNP